MGVWVFQRCMTINHFLMIQCTLSLLGAKLPLRLDSTMWVLATFPVPTLSGEWRSRALPKRVQIPVSTRGGGWEQTPPA